jgi:hypothetical protein
MNFSGSSFACEAFRLPNRVRLKAEFVSRFNVIWVVQMAREKYFAFAVGQIISRTPAVSRPQEGRFAVVTDVGRGMRWTLSA